MFLQLSKKYNSHLFKDEHIKFYQEKRKKFTAGRIKKNLADKLVEKQKSFLSLVLHSDDVE